MGAIPNSFSSTKTFPVSLRPSGGFVVEGAEVVHRGPVVTTELLRIRTPEGELIERQVVRHPGAVAVVAVDQGHVVLIEQYRAALDAMLIEIPAGKLDIAGEPLEAAARRELIEEVGLDPVALTYLGTFITAAGFCDEKLAIFGATEFVDVGRQVDGAEEAHSSVMRVPVSEIEAWLSDGRLTDAKSLIGLFWARERGILDGRA